ncbi:MAG: ABC transporter permease [Gammaproteobacteria bacterium]|nr:ABC transporter permease [Gammaproteobacteria bacterium]
MKLFGNLDLALKNLVSSKLRSILAILGVLVGTGSVVALISSSQLATAHALAQFKSLGTNLLMVNIEQNSSPGKQNAQAPHFTLSDVPTMQYEIPAIEKVAPYTSNYQAFGMIGINASGQVLGATEELADIGKIKVLQGRFVSFLDHYNLYCDIGIKLAAKMQQRGEKILGNQIKIGSMVFTIVGVLKHWQPNLFFYADIDNGVVVPIEASYMLGKNVQINNLLLRLQPDAIVSATQAKVKALMQGLVPGTRIDIHNPDQIINAISAQRKTFTWMLAAIGGISLLVGGIGVMNIMLVSVIERRREIGIRMAVGARPIDILRMFLTEGVMLTIFGGIIGVLLGVLVSFSIAELSKWQFTLYLLPPLLGFAVSVLVGLISGFYPAYRASRLDPIQTLQSD